MATKSYLPEQRPEYVEEDIWHRLHIACPDLAHGVLYQLELAAAEKRAELERMQIRFLLQNKVTSQEVVTLYGGPEELERIVGTEMLENLQCRT